MHTAWPMFRGQPDFCGVWPHTMILPDACGAGSLNCSQRSMNVGCSGSFMSGYALAWTKKCVGVSCQSTQVFSMNSQCESGTSASLPGSASGEYDRSV